jgi:hypothetical protein
MDSGRENRFLAGGTEISRRGGGMTAGRKEGQSGKEEKLIKLSRVSNIWYPRQLSIKYDCLA